MEWYPWLNVTYTKILSSYKDKKGHNFLLIQSKKNNGADSLIYALIRWLMCCKPIGIKSCNQCHGCYLMKANSHPDCYSLESEVESPSIGVERVRVLIEKLYQYAHVSTLKIVYIKSSEWLTEEAVNALLKIFEEPPNNVYFILGCKNYVHLLPTFLSRCLLWTLPLPEEKISLRWLYKKGITDQIKATTALRLCDKAPLEAYCILTSEYWRLRLRFYTELKSSIDCDNFLNILLFLKDYNCGDKIIIWLYTLFIDALKWKQGVYDFLINIDQIELISFISNKFSSLILNDRLQKYLLCLRHWKNTPNINQKLLLMYQFLNIEKNC